MSLAAGKSAAVALASGSGILSVALLVTAVVHLTAPAKAGEGREAQPVTLTRVVPPDPVESRPRPRETERRQDPVSRPLSPRRPSPRSAPMPVRPHLDWATAGPGATVLDLPEWLEADPGCSGGGETGSGPVPATASRQRPTFRWLHAPELHSPGALTRHYPRHAMRRGISGVVDVDWCTDQRGRVVSAQVHNAEPAGVFDSKALQILRSWRGSCACRGRVTIRFRLN